jgi:uncharacterized protein (UPF0305 family)
MRLQKYILNEGNTDYKAFQNIRSITMKDFEEIVDILKRDCKPFIRAKKKGMFLYRGMKNTFVTIDKIKSRLNRKPRDTPEELHDALDDAFKEKFG